MQQPPVHDGAAEQTSLLLVESHKSSSDEDALPRVRLLPDTPAVAAAFAAASSDRFFWLQHSSSSNSPLLRGYGFAGGTTADPSSGLLPVVPAWQVVLPGPILALAARNPEEPMPPYVKVCVWGGGVYMCVCQDEWGRVRGGMKLYTVQQPCPPCSLPHVAAPHKQTAGKCVHCCMHPD